MIDWDKVPAERVNEVKALDERLRKIEKGYVANFGGVVAGFYTLVELIAEFPDNKERYSEMWEGSKDYLTKMYEYLDLDQVVFDSDTAPYFICKQLYEEDLLPALNKFEKSWGADENLDVVKERVVRSSGSICDVGNLVPYRKLKSKIRSIPGCEDWEWNPIWVPHKNCTNPKYKLPE
jgi:hypothetical protein